MKNANGNPVNSKLTDNLGGGLAALRVVLVATVFPLLGYGIGMSLYSRLVTYSTLPVSNLALFIPIALTLAYGVATRRVVLAGGIGIVAQGLLCFWVLHRYEGNSLNLAGALGVTSLLVIGPGIALCFLYDLDKAVERSLKGN